MKKFYQVIFLFVFVQNVAFSQDYTRKAFTNLYTDSVTANLHMNAMAVDNNGNTYMCGSENYKWIILKFNAAGKLKWKQYYNDVHDISDEALALAIDSAGFIYVTGGNGLCFSCLSFRDLITIKYNSAGDEVWQNRFNHIDTAYITPSAISLSSNGDVLITANEFNNMGLPKLLIQKINRNGKTSLIKQMTNVHGYGGNFDKKNNIIIAGYYTATRRSQKNTQATLLKFDTAGNLLWKSVFEEPNSDGEFLYVGFDANNHIYTCGNIDSGTRFPYKSNIITAKYSEYGERLWLEKDDDGSTIFIHYEGNYKVDFKGNSYVAGVLKNYWITTKYNSNGEKLWSHTAGYKLNNKVNTSIAIAVDTLTENVFVAGNFQNSEHKTSIATVGYNKNGDSLFSDTYYKSKTYGLTIGIGIDKSGNIYTGGNLVYNYFNSITILKYSRTLLSFANVQKPAAESSLRVYPNPVVNSLTADFSTPSPSKNYKLIVSDVSGNIVLAKQLSNSEKIMHINVEVRSLKTGVYTVNITDGFNNVSKTFLKQ